MTTKLKEKLITLSRKEKELNIFLATYLVILLISIILSEYIEAIKPIVSVLGFIGIYPILLITLILTSLQKYDAETIRNNKLINLILSVRASTERLILWIIIFPIIWIITKNMEVNFISGTKIVVISIASTIMLGKIISNYFKEKLSKGNTPISKKKI